MALGASGSGAGPQAQPSCGAVSEAEEGEHMSYHPHTALSLLPVWLLEEMPVMPWGGTVTSVCGRDWKVLGDLESGQCHHGEQCEAFPSGSQQDLAPWHTAPIPCTFLGDLKSTRAGHGAGTAPRMPVSSTPQGWPGCSLLPVPQEMSQTPWETPRLP